MPDEEKRRKIGFKSNEILTTSFMDKFVQQVQVTQSSGSSEEDVMSQKAITEELAQKLNVSGGTIGNNLDINGNLGVKGTFSFLDAQGKTRRAAHIPKTATVVVGLAERGYTEDEVDVLIQPSDDVAGKIEEAVAKLGAGGEIKLLEGVYDFNNKLCKVGGDTDTEVSLSGCGSATKLKHVLLHFSGGSANNFYIEPREGSPDIIWFTRSGKKLKLSNLFFPAESLIRYYDDSNDKQLFIDNCDPIGQIYGKNKDNWRNIFINGAAEYVFSNTHYKSSKQNPNTTTLDKVPIEAGDEVSLLLYIAGTEGHETCSWTVSKEFQESGYIGSPFFLVGAGGNITCFLNLKTKTIELFTKESNWDAIKDTSQQCYIGIREIKFRKYLK